MDPEGAERARRRYACFENFGEDPQEYGYAAGLGLSHTCEAEVINQLIDLQRRAAEYARRDGRIAADDFFLRRTKRPAGEECGTILPHHVSRASIVLESPRCAYGGDAGFSSGTLCPAGAEAKGRIVGA